jgi:hypothetical protein
MQANQVFVKGVIGSFPSPESYNLIFFTVALTSLVPIALSILIKKKLSYQVLVD